jgi:hypothetical protein
MSVPVLTPKQQTSAIILPATGTFSNVVSNLPLGVYADSTDFISGAVDQVAYTYKMIGGDVLDIEITEGQIYAAYEDATLTYSYLVNLHQAKNSIGSLLGSPTGTFDSDGEIKSGSALFDLVNQNGSLSLAYPMYDITAVRDIADAFSHEAGIGGRIDIYSASFQAVANEQDYDLQMIVSSSASDSSSPLFGKVTPGNRITVKKVFLGGHSQGGYMVTRLNTMHQTNGVIANAPGPLNLVYRCQLEENGQIQPGAVCTKLKNVYGTTSNNPNAYFQRSLLNFTKGFKSDILFIQGLNDTPIQMYSWPTFKQDVLSCTSCKNSRFVEIVGGEHGSLFESTAAKSEFNTFIKNH